MAQQPYPYSSQLDAFDLYHQLIENEKSKASVLGGPALPALGHALSGASGAAVANISTYPLSLIITRLQIQRQLRKSSESDSNEYRSIRDAAQKIYEKEGGLKGFYAGLLYDTSKTIADSFLFFLAYNFIRQSRIRRQQGNSQHLPVFEELGVGFVAGAFSKFCTTPVANIVTRLQTSSMLNARSLDGGHGKPASAQSVAQQIRSEKGLKGFWSGYSASLVLTLNPSLTFFFFETLKRIALPNSRRENPPPSATFILAALSKVMASTITYPFSLAKTRAQLSSQSVDQGPDEKREPSNESYERAAASATKQKAVNRTVFSAILEIARSEGVPALYEGLGGEVMKGFFSHGITMILKDAVHKLIIQLYYVMLKLLKKYPSPEQLAEAAKAKAGKAVDAARTGIDTVQDKIQDLRSEAGALATNTLKSTATAAEQVTEEAGKAFEKGRDAATTVWKNGSKN